MNDTELDKKLKSYLGTSASQAFPVDPKILSKNGEKRTVNIKHFLLAACLLLAIIIATPTFFQGSFQAPSSIELASHDMKVYYVNPRNGHLFKFDPSTNTQERVSNLRGSFIQRKDSLFYAVEKEGKTVIYNILGHQLLQVAELTTKPVIVAIEETNIYWYNREPNADNQWQLSITNIETGDIRVVHSFTGTPYQVSLMENILIYSIVGEGPGIYSFNLRTQEASTLITGESYKFHIQQNQLIVEIASDDNQLRLYVIENGQSRLITRDILSTGAWDISAGILYYFTEEPTGKMSTISLDLITGEKQVLLEDIFFTQIFVDDQGFYGYRPSYNGALYFLDLESQNLQLIFGKTR